MTAVTTLLSNPVALAALIALMGVGAGALFTHLMLLRQHRRVHAMLQQLDAENTRMHGRITDILVKHHDRQEVMAKQQTELAKGFTKLSTVALETKRNLHDIMIDMGDTLDVLDPAGDSLSDEDEATPSRAKPQQKWVN